MKRLIWKEWIERTVYKRDEPVPPYTIGMKVLVRIDRVQVEIEADDAGLKHLAAKAAGNKTGRAKDGALTARVVQTVKGS